MAEYSIILDKLKELEFDVEYRTNEGSVFGHPYICGYLSSQDISIQIKFGDKFTSFLIEHLGHTRMNVGIEKEKECRGFIAFSYILQELIDTNNNFKKSVKEFPNLTLENNRDNQLKKLFEKNTYIPLVP